MKQLSYPVSRSIHPTIIQIVGFTIIICIYFHLRMNLIDIPLNRDEGGFAFFGRLIVQGGTLYKDGMDHKPPGIWLIYAGLSYLVPYTVRGLHWALHIYNFGTLILLGILCRRLFDWKTAFWATLFFAVITSDPEIEGFSASAEMFMLLPMVAGILLCVTGREKEMPALIYFSGLFSGMTFWIKQPAVAVSLFLVGYLIFKGIANRNLKVPAVEILLFSLGFISLSLVISGWLYLQGTWDSFIYWAFSHNLEYATGASGIGTLKVFEMRMSLLFRSNPLIWIIAAATCMILPFFNRSRGWFILGFLLSSFIAAAHSLALYRHYFALICPALALAAGAGVSQTMAWWEDRRYLRPLIFSGLILLIVGTPLFIHRDYYFINSPAQNSRAMFENNPFPEASTVAGYLREKTRPSDMILILGSEPQILIMADRKSATRHPFLYQVVGPYKRSKAFQAEVIDDMTRHRPEYVVAVHHARSWMADPRTSSAFIDDLNRILNKSYIVDALVIPDSASGMIFECRDDLKHCRAILAVSKQDSNLKAPVMVLYRRSRDPPISG